MAHGQSEEVQTMKRRFRINELAESRGMTQEALYNAIQHAGGSVSMPTIQRLWQNHKGLGDQRVSTLSAIAQALGVSIEELFEDKTDLDTHNRSGVQSAGTLKPSQVAA